jgi:hypothetical protein
MLRSTVSSMGVVGVARNWQVQALIRIRLTNPGSPALGHGEISLKARRLPSAELGQDKLALPAILYVLKAWRKDGAWLPGQPVDNRTNNRAIKHPMPTSTFGMPSETL